MTFPTGSKKAVRRLSQKSLKANRLRNLFAIVAIALTTILFTSVLTLAFGVKDSLEESSFRMAGGYAQGTYKGLNKEEYDRLKDHPLIGASGYSILVGMAENKELLKQHTEIRYFEPNAAKWMYVKVEKGQNPVGADEVAVDTAVLDLLGVPHQIGAKVPVTYRLDDKEITKDLTLTGYWDRAEGVEVSMMMVSKAFIDENLVEVSLEDQSEGVGKIFMDVMLKPTFSLESSMIKIAADAGYDAGGKGENGIDMGVNWGYMNARGINGNPLVILALLGVCLIIMFTGYLIIYNIFQIAVIADIRFYGLLKTIGTTPKQIRWMMKTQAMMLSVIGIPIGLIIGYTLGNSLLPTVLETSNFPVAYSILNPWIFIGSALFALGTVNLSCHKPGKMAAKISPIEAAKYSEMTNSQKLKKTAKNNMGRMAYSNVMRNKKKTTIVVISMALSLVLLSSVYTYTQGFDMDKYLEKFVVSDLILGHANYFSVGKSFQSAEDQPSKDYIDAVMAQKGVNSGGAIYYDVSMSEDINKKHESMLYGFDDAIVEYIEVVEGTLDLEKLKSGKYILEAIEKDDYGEIQSEKSIYQIGDQVALKTQNKDAKTYEVMAKVYIQHNASVRYRISDSTSFYLPTNVFKEQVEEPLEMAYFVDVADEYEETLEAFVVDYTTSINSDMHYESRKIYMDDFKGTQNMFFMVGAVASGIIGMIGVINFINAMVTSILTRRGEFAILQSIGMTTKQLRKMLIIEGILYSGMTLAVSYVFSSLASITLVKTLGENMWFFTYHFRVMPLVVMTPILLLVGGSIPFLIHLVVGKQTIVERLRKLHS